MSPPFTIEQFLGVFVAYNATIWPAHIAAYVLGSLAILLVWLNELNGRRVILAILGIMWAWNGIGYHFLFFAEINPAALIFAGFFLLQSILFAAVAVAPKDFRFHIGHDFRSLAGSAFIIYAMLIYPFLGILAGHGLMAGPMFGVAPCPTTIFTIGFLILARVDGPDKLAVGAGSGDAAAEVVLSLDSDGRIAGSFALDRPRSATVPFLPTPWRGWFSDYRQLNDMWIPFAGEVAWVIDGKEETYWQGHIEEWHAITHNRLGEAQYDRDLAV